MNKHKISASYGFKVKLWKHIIAYVMLIPLVILRGLAILLNIFSHSSNKNTVLIIEPFGLGDVITHEPLVRVLKEQGYDVVFCGRPVWKKIIPESESVRWQDLSVPWAVVSFAEKYRIFGNFIPAFLKTVLIFLKIGSGTIGIDTRGDARSVLLLHLAGCRKVYSLSHYIGSSMRLPFYGTHHVRQASDKLRWQLNLDFAVAMGLNLDFSTISPPNLDHLLQCIKISQIPEIAMIPFAASVGKRWPVENWQELIRMMKENNQKPHWLCGPGEKSQIIKYFGESTDCTEIDSLQRWTDEICKRKAVVSVNTGPMHIAAALGKPGVALYLTSSAKLTGVKMGAGFPDIKNLSENDLSVENVLNQLKTTFNTWK